MQAKFELQAEQRQRLVKTTKRPDAPLNKAARKRFARLAAGIENETALLKMLATLEDDAARDRLVEQVRPFLKFRPSWL